MTQTGELDAASRCGFDRTSMNWMPHPWHFHGWAAMPHGSWRFMTQTGELDAASRCGFDRTSMNSMPHPWHFHGWAAMPHGLRDFVEAQLRFANLIDQNCT